MASRLRSVASESWRPAKVGALVEMSMNGIIAAGMAFSQVTSSQHIIEDSMETPMPQCRRCGKAGDSPPPHRIPFPPEVKEKVASSVCAEGWRGGGGMEGKGINGDRRELP